MNIAQARRLYRKTEEALNRLDMALFSTEAASKLELDPDAQRRLAENLMIEATDSLVALADLDASASTLQSEIIQAVKTAKQKPFDVFYLEPANHQEGETEVYAHPIVLNGLLRRVAGIYGLDPGQLEERLSAALGHLLTICRNASSAI